MIKVISKFGVMEKALVLGAAGQIGTELVEALREKYGHDQVIAADLRSDGLVAPCVQMDATDESALRDLVKREGVTQVYQLVAMLSATGEKMPEKAWQLNMAALFAVLNMARDGMIKQVFWPSSIAAYGPNTPVLDTPQYTVMDPTTVYGVSKLAGELWCQYYHNQYGVDVRSIRYPGLISWKAEPGGGTTDYAIDIFHAAKMDNAYTCFLAESTRLPMMHMSDAIRATLELMDAPAEDLTVWTSYNVAGVDFTPFELAEALRVHYPELAMRYAPDYRQAIASTWPQRVDDAQARADWNWRPEFDLEALVSDMVANV